MLKSTLSRQKQQRNQNQHRVKVPAVVGHKAPQEPGRGTTTVCVGVKTMGGYDGL